MRLLPALGRVLLCAALITTVLASGSPSSAQPGQGSAVFINEIHYDNAGTDTGEFVEIAGVAGTDLAGWSLVAYNGNGGAPYDTVSLSGAIDDQSDGYGFVAVDIAGLQNGGADGIALVDGTTVVQFLSYEGTLTAVGGPADGLTSTDIGVSESSGTPVGSSLQLSGEGLVAGDFTWSAPAPNTRGAVNIGQVFGEGNGGGGGGTGAEVVKIHQVQGSGPASPMVGETVTIEGVVVGDYEGPSPALRGFYVQEQDGDVDGDPATSEAVFVFHGSSDSVNLGDLVEVTGTVEEYFDQTQIGFPSELTVISSGNTVTPAELSLPLASADALEALEAMLVVAPQTLYVTEFFQLGRFGQIVVSSGDRLAQPTSVASPGPDAMAVQAANDLNRLIVDDATNNQNPDPILFGRGGQPLSATNTLRGGDTVTGLVGVLSYTWAGNSASGNAYRLRPVGDLSDSGLVAGGVVPNFEPANPRPGSRPDVGGSVQVASFNVLNYFPTPDLSDVCGPDRNLDCRGADDDEELARQRAKLVAALETLDADVVGLIEIENTPGVSPEADLAQRLNESLGDDRYASIDAAVRGGGVVGTDAIRVGLIYQPGVVTPVGDPALHEFSVDALGQDRSRTAVAQTFKENATGAVFTVVVNHLKSKGGSEIATGICATDPAYADCDQGDGQGYFNAIRTTHAAELAAWLAGDPTGSGDADVLVLGDLNAYAKEDPLSAFASAGFINPYADDDYSYVFDGQWGYLDHILVSDSIGAASTGLAHHHINADEPSVLDYNTNFKSAAQIADLYAPDQFRTSDHDPALIGLDLSVSSPATTAISVTELSPPDGRRHNVVLSVEGEGAGDYTLEILSVVSSEADRGLGPKDRPNDIVRSRFDKLGLRAECFNGTERVYTIEVKLTNGTQTVYNTLTVTVPC